MENPQETERTANPVQTTVIFGGELGSAGTVLTGENPCDIGVFHRFMIAAGIGTILI
jgi:hypothetical protein